MATTSLDEAIVSAQNKKSEPKSLIQDKSIPNTTKETGSFLETGDLAHFVNCAWFAARACQPEMRRRRKLSEGLLAPVFNADPKKVAEFFALPNSKKEMVLAQTCYCEGYESKKQKKFVVFRHWKNVSALQATALCLDKFLVIQLLAQIVADDTLRLEAKKQLEEIRNRIVIDHKEKQNNINSAAKDTSSTAPTNDSSKSDKKELLDKAQQNPSADLSEYGAPIKALLKAYSDYLNQYQSLSSQDRWDEIDKLWDVVGSCHKRLPRYILQEIFKDKRWDDDPEFSLEPPRGELRVRDCLRNTFADVDLDSLGDGTCVGLYKAAQGGGVGAHEDLGGLTAVFGTVDSEAISSLYEIRIQDLTNIIDALSTPETALALTTSDSDKSMGLKQS